MLSPVTQAQLTDPQLMDLCAGLNQASLRTAPGLLVIDLMNRFYAMSHNVQICDAEKRRRMETALLMLFNHAFAAGQANGK